MSPAFEPNEFSAYAYEHGFGIEQSIPLPFGATTRVTGVAAAGPATARAALSVTRMVASFGMTGLLRGWLKIRVPRAAWECGKPVIRCAASRQAPRRCSRSRR